MENPLKSCFNGTSVFTLLDAVFISARVGQVIIQRLGDNVKNDNKKQGSIRPESNKPSDSSNQTKQIPSPINANTTKQASSDDNAAQVVVQNRDT
ncbi:unnamed protein product, partial [Didymodactylos carnosus]